MRRIADRHIGLTRGKPCQTFRRGLAIVCFLAMTLLLCAAGYPQPTNSFYVNDYAHVLSDSTSSYILEKSAALEKETGAQLVVLTVETLGGQEAADYSLKVGREWGIGDKEKNNGLLLLLCPQEGEIFVQVGMGLQGALNDAKVGRLIDRYALGDYKNGDFDSGTKKLYDALLSEVMLEYHLDALPGYTPDSEYAKIQAPKRNRGAGKTVLFIIMAFVVIVYAIYRGGGGFGSGHSSGGGFGSGHSGGGGFGGGHGGGGGFGSGHSGGGGFGGGHSGGGGFGSGHSGGSGFGSGHSGGGFGGGHSGGDGFGSGHSGGGGFGSGHSGGSGGFGGGHSGGGGGFGGGHHSGGGGGFNGGGAGRKF